MPKISVIIPVYNVDDYLSECLNSVVNQTLKDIEIICVNDGSTDSSFNILKDFAFADSRFILLDQENQGQGIARNKALEIVKGEYTAFVDPDDWLELDAFENIYNFAENNNAEVVQFNYKTFDNDFKKFKEVSLDAILKKKYRKDFHELKMFNWKDFKNACLQDLDLHAWNRLYKTDFIKQHNLKFAPLRRAEDHLFVLGAILSADKIFYYPASFYNYRIRNNSTVNSKSKENFQIFQVLDMTKNLIEKLGLYDDLKEELNIYNTTILTWHYLQTPIEYLDKYTDMCKKYLSDAALKKMIKDVNKKRSFIENIFSLKNKKENGVKYKVITILGFSFVLSKTLRLKNGSIYEKA